MTYTGKKSCKIDIIDPYKQSNFPIIVLAHKDDSIVGSAINCITHGSYNHVMWQIDRYTMASQEAKGFVRVDVSKFLINTYKLKFFTITNRYYRSRLLSSIKEQLLKPWYKRRYDFLGILGQAIGIQSIQSPFGQFCSEQMAVMLNKVCHLDLPKRPSPSELNKLFKLTPYCDIIKLIGYWFSE